MSSGPIIDADEAIDTATQRLFCKAFFGDIVVDGNAGGSGTLYHPTRVSERSNQKGDFFFQRYFQPLTNTLQVFSGAAFYDQIDANGLVGEGADVT